MTYMLRLKEEDADLWERAKAKADREGRSMRGLIMWLLAQYVKGRVAS